jgi:phosphoribosylamine--glycine ligase
VLIVGGGGREHALAWKVAQSPVVERVFVAPGNAGTACEAKLSNVPIPAQDIDSLLDFARKNAIGLTIIGPEAPLVEGIVDRFQAAGLPVFGPTAGAARLEGSKAFSKAFLNRCNIPTANYQVFTELPAAIAYIDQSKLPIVIKADGLAAGKGVTIAKTHAQAAEAATRMLAGNAFGRAGHRVVIEEFLSGEEASFICMVDGKNILPMATSQDHKARDDGDTGPNTGGMGAYSPAPVIDEAMHRQIMQQIIQPTVEGMADDGCPFTGFLYAGVMIGEDGTARVIEFNARFGDPEAQPIMMRLRGDLAAMCLAACEQKLDQIQIEWDSRSAVGVVMAAAGYPANYAKDKPITGLENLHDKDAKIFHAGTAVNSDGNVVTAGGRVLCVVGLGSSVDEAQRTAYNTVDKIHWQGVYFRRDIGHRAIARNGLPRQ